jgi:large conductance mechanosensitive channel
MKKVMAEFKEFILRGNVLDLAIGVIIGVAFNAIVSSLVNDIIMPPIGRLFGNMDFSSLFINMSGTHYDSLAAAKEAGAAVISYGSFLNAVINFLIIAFVLFLMIKAVNRTTRLTKPKTDVPPAPATKECPFCCSSVPIKATRCPHCTSELK